MKTGRLMTAAALMLASAAATVRKEIEAFAVMVQGGNYRYRGKGRGGVIWNFYGKTRRCTRETGKRECARRERQVRRALGDPFKQLARAPGWKP